MTLKNNKTHLLSYFKLCASFHSQLSIPNGVTVRKRQIWVKISDFFSRVTLRFHGWPRKTTGHLFYAPSSFVYHFIAVCEIKMKLQSGNTKFGSKSAIFFVPCDLEIWQMTLKNNRTPLLCYFKLTASFHSHLWIQDGVTVRLRSIWVKIGDFFSRVTLKCDGWPWKIIGHLFYVISSFVHHLIAIYEFKMELQSGNAKFGSKSANFLSCVALKFDGWPWKTVRHLFCATSSFVLHFIAIYEFKMELQSGNAKFGSKSAIFLSCVTLKFDGWPWKTMRHLFCATSSFVLHFIAICEFKSELQSGNAKFGSKSVIFCHVWPWPLTLTFCMDITSVNGNNSWKFLCSWSASKFKCS